MTEGNGLPQEFNQRRLDEVASGTFAPAIPGLPGIKFIKLINKAKGIASRAYSKRLMELYKEGGVFSKALIPTYLERQATEAGIDPKAHGKMREAIRLHLEKAPAELKKPYDELTDEEVALLSPESQDERRKAVEEHGRKCTEYMAELYKNEEYKRLLFQAEQLEQLETHLLNNSAEHLANMHRVNTELLLCCVREDDEKPYFASIEEVEELEERLGTEIMKQLYIKWHQFKHGLDPQFFRPDSSPE